MICEVSEMSRRRCCYSASLEFFLQENKTNWIKKMKEAFQDLVEMPLGESQVRAWKDCFDVLMEQLPAIYKTHPNFDIVFEYCLPYESGRRPDVLLISKEQVIVLEFKQNFRVIHADIDQTAAYARDIYEYHLGGRNIVTEFYKYLYEDATIFLSRKKDKFDKYLKAKCR